MCRVCGIIHAGAVYGVACVEAGVHAGVQSHAILLSSDDDDESAGLVAGAKRWWGSSAKVKQPPR